MTTLKMEDSTFTSQLDRFFNYNYFSKMTNIPDDIVLEKIMTALDLEFKRALHYLPWWGLWQW